MKSTEFFFFFCIISFFLTFVLNKFTNEYYKFVYLTAKILAYRLKTRTIYFSTTFAIHLTQLSISQELSSAGPLRHLIVIPNCFNL